MYLIASGLITRGVVIVYPGTMAATQQIFFDIFRANRFAYQPDHFRLYVRTVGLSYSTWVLFALINTVVSNTVVMHYTTLNMYEAEAVQRAATIAEAEGVSKIEATNLERILPRLPLDF
ncbi:hypothetical protein FEM48_Zijuj05G0059900 [Ziziphus jujuba var. spinosa]|uniref:Uncharacterized protein n=1 Tax=Ziziphus jujuba var. spinosa TaxID=714518 RepID=A0A978VD78_ZIZJJ|nr:hypothetical protein FEM48_Zijuj05G0059900 [Ziziphus jujuba var. spinosa]